MKHDMAHFEQHCKNQISNGLDITTLDKAEIKRKEVERVHRGTGRARSTSLEKIFDNVREEQDAVHPDTVIETRRPSQVSSPNKYPFYGLHFKYPV